MNTIFNNSNTIIEFCKTIKSFDAKNLAEEIKPTEALTYYYCIFTRSTCLLFVWFLGRIGLLI